MDFTSQRRDFKGAVLQQRIRIMRPMWSVAALVRGTFYEEESLTPRNPRDMLARVWLRG